MERIFVKLGSSAIVKNGDGLDESLLTAIAEQVAYLRRTYQVQTTIVSSGAIASGRVLVPSLKGDIEDKQAAAIYGQPDLITAWKLAFQKYNILVGEALLKDEDLPNFRRSLLRASEFGVVILNGPDATYDPTMEKEIISIDNDRLSRYSAYIAGASKLIMLTETEGILDQNLEVISEIASLYDLQRIAFFEKTTIGTGGPGSKVSEARKFITDANKVAYIAGARTPDVIVNIIKGERVGTRVTLPLQGYFSI